MGTKPEGDMSEGDTPEGNTPEGKTPDGTSLDGNTPDGTTPEGNTPDGYSVGYVAPTAPPVEFPNGYGAPPPIDTGTIAGAAACVRRI